MSIAADTHAPTAHECPTLELRAIAPPDLPQIVSLDQLCFGGLWTAEGYQREIDSPNSDLYALFYRPPEATAAITPIGIGCLWAILEEAHLTLLGIHPHYRRQGLGQLLLYVLLYSAQQRGLERATLEVRAGNQGAIALYDRCGFRTVGRRPKYYPDDEDALILWRHHLDRPEFLTDLQDWQLQIQRSLNLHGWHLAVLEPNLGTLSPPPAAVKSAPQPESGG